MRGGPTLASRAFLLGFSMLFAWLPANAALLQIDVSGYMGYYDQSGPVSYDLPFAFSAQVHTGAAQLTFAPLNGISTLCDFRAVATSVKSSSVRIGNTTIEDGIHSASINGDMTMGCFDEPYDLETWWNFKGTSLFGDFEFVISDAIFLWGGGFVGESEFDGSADPLSVIFAHDGELNGGSAGLSFNSGPVLVGYIGPVGVREVPEPGTLGLFAIGLWATLVCRGRRSSFRRRSGAWRSISLSG